MSTIGLTDAPITSLNDESLGLTDYVTALSNFICDCETPITISCQGDWGSGKTSMMNLVREKLDNNESKTIITKWFNTWQFAQFQMQDQITLSLLSNFIKELGDDETLKKIKELGRFLINKIGRVASAVSEATVGTGEVVKDFIDVALPQQEDPIETVSQLKKQIEKSVEKLLKENRADRIVVFIDDLDRLMPERAVEILEIIKIFLDVNNCVFVLAVDHHVVFKGLEQKFGVSMGDLKGKNFFDKIIQLPFNLPIAQYDTRNYMVKLLSDRIPINNEDMENLLNLARYSVGSNPRALKRLFNTLQLLTLVAKSKQMLENDGIATKEERHHLLFALLCLQLAYESVYKMLHQDQDKIDGKYFKSLKDKELLQNRPSQLSIVKKSLPMGGDLEEEEALTRFCEFMKAFESSVFLDAQRNGNDSEELSPQEIALMRSFLSLSALTSTTGGSSKISGDFRYEAEIVNFVEKALTPKFGAKLASMKTELETEFGYDSAIISFMFELREFAFSLIIYWDDNQKNIRAVLYKVDSAVTKLVKDWFMSQKERYFPKIEFKHLRSYEYAVIESLPLSDELTDEKALEAYFQLADRTLTSALPPLEILYATKSIHIQKISEFSEKVVNRLQDVFTSNDGWEIKNNFQIIQQPEISIMRPAWSENFSIDFTAGKPFALDLYVRLWVETEHFTKKQVVDLIKKCNEIFKDAECEIFNKNATEAYESQVGFGFLIYDIDNLTTGGFLDPSFGYYYKKQIDEKNAIDKIVELLGRFKKIQMELDKFAASAKPP